MTTDQERRKRSTELFLDGMRTAIPILIGTAPFGFLVGMVSVDNGLTVGQAVLMSATVYGGASQLVGLDLYGSGISALVVVLAIMAVNLRHVLYSAVLGRYMARWSASQQFFGFFMFADPQFAESAKRVENGGAMEFSWYMGVALPAYLLWPIETWIGAYFGLMIPNPAAFGIDFLLPIYFFGLVLGFRHRPRWLPIAGSSAVVAALAHTFIGAPWHISLGAVTGILVGAFLAPVDSKAKASLSRTGVPHE